MHYTWIQGALRIDPLERQVGYVGNAIANRIEIQ